jgi:hypothetical protein
MGMGLTRREAPALLADSAAVFNVAALFFAAVDGACAYNWMIARVPAAMP